MKRIVLPAQPQSIRNATSMMFGLISSAGSPATMLAYDIMGMFAAMAPLVEVASSSEGNFVVR